MEVAHNRHAQAALVETFDNRWNRRRGFLVVHRDAHNLGAGQRQRLNLFDRALNVRRVGVGHRLHDDRNLPANANLPNPDRPRFPALNLRHTSILPLSLLSRNPWPTLTACSRPHNTNP